MNQMNTFITAFPDALVFFTMTMLSLVLLILFVRKNRTAKDVSADHHFFIGLIVLLALQCVMLVINVIGWSIPSENAALIILLDRWVITLSVIWLLWVLIPIRKRVSLVLAGSISLLVSFIALIAFFLMLSNPYFREINFAYLALLSSLIILGCLLVSLIFVIIKRPSQWAFLILILIVQIVSFVGQLTFAFSMVLPIWLRLGYWLTLMLLGSMVCNIFLNQAPVLQLKDHIPQPSSSISTRVASTFLELSLQNSSQKLLNSLSHALSLYSMSDICGFVDLNLEESELRVSHVYDLFLEDHLKDFELTFQQVPQLSQAFLNHHSISIDDTASQDLISLFTATQFNQLGEVTLMPLKYNGHAVNQALLLLTPYTTRHIDPTILADLEKIAPTILKLFTQAKELDNQKVATDSLLISINQVTSQKNDLHQQLERSHTLLAELRTKYADSKASHQQEVQQLSNTQRMLEDELTSLKDFIEKSTAALNQLNVLTREKEHLETALNDCKKNSLALKSALFSAKSLIDASIGGNSQIAIDASIIADSEAPSRQINEYDETNPEYQARLSDILQQAQLQLTPQLDQKELRLIVKNNTGKEIIIPAAEQTQSLLESLLINAINVSPNQQSIQLELLLEQPENENPGLLIQVTDLGGGLSPSEQANFFAMIDRKDKPVPGGIGDANAIRSVIQLVKQLNGNLWLKSGIDKPTTFRIRLPLGLPPVQSRNLDA